MKAIELKIDQFILDTMNRRTGATENQRAAMQSILDDPRSKLFNLAKSIVNDGMSPIEMIMVMKDKSGSDQYITLEGNRRVAALKILVNPHVLTALNVKPNLRKRFEKLAEDFDAGDLEPIVCAQAKDREEADRWIYRRHAGEDDGRGVVEWPGLAKARYRGSNPALQALDLVAHHGDLTAEQVGTLQDFPITTLQRLLDSPDVRKLIGVEISDGKLRSGLPAPELIKPLKRIVLDLASGDVTVTKVKLVGQQIDYVNGLPATVKPNLSQTGTVRPVAEIGRREFPSDGGKSAQQKRRKYDSSERHTIAPRRLKLNFGNESRIGEVYGELQDIRAEKLRNAGAVLFRVFLEMSVDCYMDRHKLSTRYRHPKGGNWVNKELNRKVSDVIEHMAKDPTCDSRKFANVKRGLSVDHSPMSINLLHDYVHNRFVTPRGRDLLAAWNDSQAFFERVWA